MSFKHPVLVVHETHRIEGLDLVSASLLAGFINDTGKTVTDEGRGIYDYAELNTEYEATLEEGGKA